jgi:hypothetical protein
MSKKPESKSSIPPTIAAENTGPPPALFKLLDEYTMPARTDKPRLNVVQKLADRPVDAKLFPTFVNEGSSESLSLLSNSL